MEKECCSSNKITTRLRHDSFESISLLIQSYTGLIWSNIPWTTTPKLSVLHAMPSLSTFTGDDVNPNI